MISFLAPIEVTGRSAEAAAGESSDALRVFVRWNRRVIQQTHRVLAWALLAALLAYLSYLSFRAYLSPEFLIGFANLFSC